jgi:beta-1,4-mannooligosaccharide/beta-1,4-mannosyl-N-acetylglucosamine phosphorylase
VKCSGKNFDKTGVLSMSMVKIIGRDLPNIPWEDKPAGYDGVVWRYSKNPITQRNMTKSSGRIFNSGVCEYEDGFIGIFRSDSKAGNPDLLLGKSKDGIRWEFEDQNIQWEDEDGNDYIPNCPYDPRLLKIDDTYYASWCTDFNGPAIAIGKTKNFKKFVRLDNATIPFNRNGVLFPRKVNGLYQLLSRPSDNGHTPFGDIYLSQSPDLTFWGKHRKVMASGINWWQATKIGAGPEPIETTEGWLMFYHGVTKTCSGLVYSFGAAILDINEPSKVLYRTRQYLLTPEMPYETIGYVPNVCFPCANLYDAKTGRIAIYYGCADTYIGICFAEVNELVNHIKSDSQLGQIDDRLIK